MYSMTTYVMLWQVKNFELDLLLGISLISPMILLLSNNNWVWKLYELPSSSQITKLCRFWRPTLFLLCMKTWGRIENLLNWKPLEKFQCGCFFYTFIRKYSYRINKCQKGVCFYFCSRQKIRCVVIIVSYQWIDSKINTMGLLPLEFTECLQDSPYFRDSLHSHEKELERTSNNIKELIKEVKNLLHAAKSKSSIEFLREIVWSSVVVLLLQYCGGGMWWLRTVWFDGKKYSVLIFKKYWRSRYIVYISHWFFGSEIFAYCDKLHQIRENFVF